MKDVKIIIIIITVEDMRYHVLDKHFIFVLVLTVLFTIYQFKKKYIPTLCICVWIKLFIKIKKSKFLKENVITIRKVKPSS